MQAYAKPVIHKLHSGTMNKFAGAAPRQRRVRSEIAGVPVEELVQRFGSPLFVYSERTLRRQFRTIRNAFATRYPEVTFGWSYKTNYLKAICAILHQEGAMAELVSKMEYDKAKVLGVPGQQIIWNGPHKPFDALEAAVRDGVTINIDHLDEVEDLEAIATRLGRPLEVGMRLNLDSGIQPCWSRFGFNLESGQAMDVVQRLVDGGKLRLVGLHCHIGTFIMDPQAYAQQVEKMVQFGYDVEARWGWRMNYLDIGGGFPSRSRLKGVYHAADVVLPSIDDYADAICDTLWRTLKPGHRPRLIIESGRAVIDEAGSLITSICGTKRLPNGTPAYVMDAGVNLLFTAFWYRFDIAMARAIPGPCEISVLYGPLCMNIDVVDEGISLPPLSRGDRLVVSTVGAYNNTQWLQFIEYRPNVVLVTEAGEVELIRSAEDLSDLDRREHLPSHLATRSGMESQPC
ncbi:diaminopimelate decarboxylase [Leptolyngbya sp. 'hensonii']|uniref:alanine racemase n=1 Tax=Leptolyngbya sp. 'hensonii' TaxID=1922337 RepID=UPI00094FCE4A|nr:alanine racemase [Leptolyngbya sp. 'hensonii']OLP19641.1 diaminopimelate decarboxylase [Leptolyngbya sp. 'hensonii']